jgi:hypothetical protein
MATTTKVDPAPVPGGEGPQPEEDLVAALRRLAELAQRGDRQAERELGQRLDECPELWMRCGDLARHALERWTALVAGPDPLFRACLERQIEALRGELLGEAPSALERLVVERVLAGWVQAYHIDALYAGVRKEDATAELLRELQRRQESTQRRYLAAIKQLALVRRLLRPVPSPLDLARAQVAEGAARRPGQRRGMAVGLG